MRQGRRRDAVGFETVQEAVQGDADSINRIIAYFQPYIRAKCKRKFRDEFGCVKYVEDEYMRRRLETKLITKILDFKIQS